MSDIWQDPRVRDALKDGRTPDDIAILTCPKCHQQGYYNQGSHFTCLECDIDFWVCSEGEDAPEHLPHIVLDGFTSLADVTDEQSGP